MPPATGVSDSGNAMQKTLLRPKCWSSSAHRHEGGTSSQLQIVVRNYGPRAIVDAEFVSLLIEGHEHLDLDPTSEAKLPVVVAGGDGNFMFDPGTDEADPVYRAVIGRWEKAPGGLAVAAWWLRPSSRTQK